MILKNNEFITLASNFFDSMISTNRINTISGNIISVKKLFKPERYEFSPDRSDKDWYYNDLDSRLEELLNDIFGVDNPDNLSVSFDTILKFCQLTKFAEKSVFYKNIFTEKLDQSFVYVEAVNEEEDSYNLIINDADKYYIRIKFELSLKSLYEGMDKSEIIKITVKRNYGSQMVNEFIIVDRECKYKDIADYYLIESINIILYNTLLAKFKEIFEFYKEFFSDYCIEEKFNEYK